MCLLLGIILECILLFSLAFFKKLTKKAFFAVSAITVCFCIIAVFMEQSGKRSSGEVNQKDFLYMAARLVEEGYEEEALEALSQVTDDECMQYGSRTLRGLVYNINEAYGAAVLCLEGDNTEEEEKIYEDSLNEQMVADELKNKVIENSLTVLELSENEKVRLDAEMKLRFLPFGAEDGQAEDTDAWIQSKIAVEEGNYEEAYEIMLKAANKGGMRESIVVSNMYINNYNQRSLSESDEQYDALLKKVTNLQTELNVESLSMPDVPETEGNIITEKEKDYNKKWAEYSMALEELHNEAVKRAINYMLYVRPKDYENNIAYQLQMARLYYLSNQKEMAKECLDYIFAVEAVDTTQWMGTEAYLLREAFLLFESEMNNEDFDLLFSQMMKSLYQGMFEENYENYKQFVKDYLRDLFSGLRIGAVDISAFPTVTVEVSGSDDDLLINKENIWISDTKESIAEFVVQEKKQENMSICFVLDRSGSMSGGGIENAKKALKECVVGLDSSVQIGLVSFENDARIDCGLTKAKYAVVNQIEAMTAYGGTNIAAGLESAYEVLQEAAGTRVIILLSDGYDGNKEGLSSVLGALKTDNIAVYSLGLQGCDEQYLKRISDETDGTYIPVENSKNLVKIYQEISKYLECSYYITYEVTEKEVEEREVLIGVNETMTRTRKSYKKTEEPKYNEGGIGEEQKADYFRQIGGSLKGDWNE